MANTNSSIFNKSAQDRLRSPDDLDRYVRVTTPSVWVLLLAIGSLTIGLLAWGVFGSVSTSVSAAGTCVDGKTICLLDADQVVSVSDGDHAYVDGRSTRVASVSKVPISRSEAQDLLKGDYLVETLMPGNWAYLVVFEDVQVKEEGVPFSVSITTERVAPISLVLG